MLNRQLTPNALHLTPEDIVALVEEGLFRRGFRGGLRWVGGAPTQTLTLHIRHSNSGDQAIEQMLRRETENGSVSFWHTLGVCCIDCETASRVISASEHLELHHAHLATPMIRRKRTATKAKRTKSRRATRG